MSAAGAAAAEAPSQAVALVSGAPPQTKKRQLPADPAEFEKAIARHRAPARMIVGTVDSANRLAGMEPLTDDEKENGTDAFAAWVYENLPELGATGMVVLWLGCVEGPRLAKKAAELEKKRRAEKSGVVQLEKPAEVKAA